MGSRPVQILVPRGFPRNTRVPRPLFQETHVCRDAISPKSRREIVLVSETLGTQDAGGFVKRQTAAAVGRVRQERAAGVDHIFGCGHAAGRWSNLATARYLEFVKNAPDA